MTAKKLSILLFAIGVVFATTLSLLFRFYNVGFGCFLLFFEEYNPVPIIDIAFWITSMVFDRMDHSRIVIETEFCDIVMIILFGLECALVGLIFFKIWDLIKRKYCIKRKI